MQQGSTDDLKRCHVISKDGGRISLNKGHTNGFPPGFFKKTPFMTCVIRRDMITIPQRMKHLRKTGLFVGEQLIIGDCIEFRNVPDFYPRLYETSATDDRISLTIVDHELLTMLKPLSAAPAELAL